MCRISWHKVFIRKEKQKNNQNEFAKEVAVRDTGEGCNNNLPNDWSCDLELR